MFVLQYFVQLQQDSSVAMYGGGTPQKRSLCPFQVSAVGFSFVQLYISKLALSKPVGKKYTKITRRSCFLTQFFYLLCSQIHILPSYNRHYRQLLSHSMFNEHATNHIRRASTNELLNHRISFIQPNKTTLLVSQVGRAVGG